MTSSGFQERKGTAFRAQAGVPRPPVTRAADGLPRRAFTNSDIEKMIEAGIIDEDEHFELIRGDILPMNAEYDRHGRTRQKLLRVFMRALGDEWFVATELSLFLADDTEVKPDLHVFPSAMKSEDVRGPDVRFVVELSSTTQKKDLEIKAPIYAAHGVRELRVIDLDARQGFVFNRIEHGAYEKPRLTTESELLIPRAFPSVSLRISDLY